MSNDLISNIPEIKNTPETPLAETPDLDVEKLLSSYQSTTKNFENLNDEEKAELTGKVRGSALKLVNFVKKNGEWIDNDLNKKAVFFAIDAMGDKANLDMIKKFLDDARAEVKNEHQSQERTKSAQAERLNVKSPRTNSTPDLNEGNKWFSKEEIKKMSDAEYIKNGRKISLQMELEKQGKLPRTIV